MSIETSILYILLFASLYFEVFLLVSFIEYVLVSHRKGAAKLPAELPRVAIIVPCWNEEKTIALTMRSLLALEYPADKLEVIVVDDGSRDRTYEVASQFTSDPRVRVFRKENGGKHSAMNFALPKTEADLIGCLDADSEVEPGGLHAVVPAFVDPQVGAVTPAILVRNPETWLQYLQNAEYRVSLFSRFMLARLGSSFITPGPFSIFRASVVKQLGGWRHAHSTEDMEIALRIQAAGYKIGNAPGAVVRTSPPRTLRALIKQRTRWAYGGMRNMIDFRHMFGNRRYGNLGLFILPFSAASIATAAIFVCILVYNIVQAIMHTWLRVSIMGFHPSLPTAFYLNTSAMWFVVWLSVALIAAVIMAGSWIGTGKRRLPQGTITFMLLYSFIAPMWLFNALYKVARGAGVSWR